MRIEETTVIIIIYVKVFNVNDLILCQTHSLVEDDFIASKFIYIFIIEFLQNSLSHFKTIELCAQNCIRNDTTFSQQNSLVSVLREAV